MPPISFIAGILTALAAAGTSVPQPGPIQTYKDWAVGCDNIGNCEAVSLLSGDGMFYDDWGGPVSIVRTAGTDDIFKIRILFEEKNLDRYRMIVDGRLVDTGPVVPGNYPIEIVGEDAKKVAKAIVRGSQMTIRGPAEEMITRISLAGTSAALRYMDDQQGRVNSASALVARGDQPFQPQPTAIPVIMVDPWQPATKIPETGALVALVEESQCKDDRYGVVEDQAFPLGERDGLYRALVLISCGSGAYNFSSAPFIGEYREDDPAGWTFTPAKFDRQPAWGGEGSPPLLVNASWDENDQTLSSYGKGRGLGDCGSAQNYVWDGEAFRLIDASAMDECRGAYEWITTWRAQFRKVETKTTPAE